MIVTIVLAWLYASVWALVIGNLVSALTTTLFSHVLVPEIRNRLHMNRGAAVSLLHFGKWVFFGTICTFVGNQSDRLVIGKLSLTLLGVYHIGAALAAIPITLLGTIAMQLVFPLYARLLQRGRPAAASFARVHPACAGFAAFLVSALIAAGPTFIQLAYDSRYQGASWIVPILAVGAWFQMLEILIDAKLWGLGKANVSAVSNFAKVLALPLLAVLGYWLAGIEGLIVGFAASDLVRYAVSVWYVRRYHRVPVLRYDVSLTILIVTVSTIALAAGEWLWADPATLLQVPGGGDLPAALSPEKNWTQLLRRFATELGLVALLWGIVLLISWSKGIVRTSWREDEM
jgi:O-antigen/teichoic acid export membrane protein